MGFSGSFSIFFFQNMLTGESPFSEAWVITIGEGVDDSGEAALVVAGVVSDEEVAGVDDRVVNGKLDI